MIGEKGGEYMKDKLSVYNKLIRIGGALVVAGLMYGAANFASAEDELPVTPPVTPSVSVSPSVSPMVTVTPTVSPSITPTATPALKVPAPATGGVWAQSGSDTLKINFNAFGEPQVKGTINYSSSNGDRFNNGKVNICFAQNGNQAVFAGMVGKGNVHNLYFLMRVEDNGEGKRAPRPDKVGIWFSDAMPTCSFGEIPLEVIRGNVQVRR